MPDITKKTVDAIGDAFNRNDVEAVMSFFSDDAIFDHAVGPDAHGARFSGADAIREVFDGLFRKVKNVHWETLKCSIEGQTAYCHYNRTATHMDGSKEEFLSVDILTFHDGLIVHKDTYYKQRTA